RVPPSAPNVLRSEHRWTAKRSQPLQACPSSQARGNRRTPTTHFFRVSEEAWDLSGVRGPLALTAFRRSMLIECSGLLDADQFALRCTVTALRLASSRTHAGDRCLPAFSTRRDRRS